LRYFAVITVRVKNFLNILVISDTALSAAMRYILKTESDDRRAARRKLYCIIAGSAVWTWMYLANR
jgi:hypothetical protein